MAAGAVDGAPVPSPEPMDTVLVVDFGAQYAQLIARRVREAHVYSEIVPSTITADELRARGPKAVILSGGPKSVHVEGAPSLDPAVYALGIPVLGICYGAQLIALKFVICLRSLPSSFMVQTSAIRPCSSKWRQTMRVPSVVKKGPPS